jgi:predicted nucleic acid-binding protein
VPVPPVVDASPLIVLARTNLLPLLHLAGDPILVPRAVAQEVLGRGQGDPAAQALRSTHWLNLVDPGPTPVVLQPYRLGAGEAAALTWALTHPGTLALFDDLLARRCATLLHVPVRGTLGLVMSAKQHGVISLARPVLEQLRQSGLYVSDQVMNQALALVGE